MTVIAPVIDTERLRLRPYEMGDLDDLFAYRTRPDVTRYVYREPRDRDDVAAGLSRRARATS
jgi:RimJ/RimL family protein N-acetyltransferase